MQIKKAAAIGGGVIGAGWVARLALNGVDVSVFDPAPDAQRKVDEVMAGARRARYQPISGGCIPSRASVAARRRQHARARCVTCSCTTSR